MKLTLVMIVKNEANNIRATIESCRGLIDACVIMDTGSTDGTQDVVQRAMHDFGFGIGTRKGLFLGRPFEDFSTSRNYVIEQAMRYLPGNWQLMLSGTETVSSAQTLFHELDYWTTRSTFNAFHIEMRCGAMRFPSLRIFNPKAGWRYKGRYHELLTAVEGCSVGPNLKGVWIDYKGGEDKTESWRRAIPLLEMDAKENPADGRPIFYLAEVHRCLGAKAVARLLYEKRAEMKSGYVEERAMSLLYAGRIASEANNNFTGALQNWLDAYAICPHRAEPLWELGSYYHLRGYRENDEELYALAYLYGCAAYEKPIPDFGLFVEMPVYQWQVPDLVATHAVRYNDFVRGEQAAKKAADHVPVNDLNYQRVQNNYSWYLSRGK